jgi:hypothetical protein
MANDWLPDPLQKLVALILPNSAMEISIVTVRKAIPGADTIAGIVRRFLKQSWRLSLLSHSVKLGTDEEILCAPFGCWICGCDFCR